MHLRKYSILIAIFIGLIIQVFFVSSSIATGIYLAQSITTSTNLISGSSASAISNFHYNLSALPSGSSVNIQFSKDNSNWYSVAGVLNGSTALGTLGGADLSLTTLNWSGSSFYYRLTMNATSDLSDTPVMDDIRLDYTASSGYEKLIVFNNNGSLGIGTTDPHALLSVGDSSQFQVNASGDILSSGNLTIRGTSNSSIAGNLGIGTSFPGAKLQVVGADYLSTSFAANISGVNGLGLVVTNVNNVGIGTTTPLSSLGILGNLSVGTTYGNIAAPAGGAIFEGNVGIGTTSPDKLLSVIGDMRLGPTNATGTLYGYSLNFSASRTLNDAINFITNAGTSMTILASGNVGIGTTTPTALLNLKSTTALESAPLGSELLSSSNWTTTGWTGDFTGFTHTAGNTTALTNTLAAVTNNLYQISYTVTNGTPGSFTISFGGVTSPAISATGTWGPKAISTGALSITPTTDFVGTVVISIKQITGTYSPTYAIADSANNNILEIRSSPATRRNTFIGLGAGSYNTTGSTNTANGYYSLYWNTTGYSSVANGFYSLFWNTTGYSNTANGNYSLFSNTTGYSNTANGYQSLYSNTTGSYNTAIGLNSGRYILGGSAPNQTSNNSLYIGYNTMALSDGDTNEIVIGYSAVGAGSNSVVLGNDSITKTILKGNVGIGTGSPGAKLDVVAGTSAEFQISNPSSSDLLLKSVSPIDGTVSNYIFNAWKYKFQVNGTEKVQIDNNGNVGIGTTNPTSILYVKGSGNNNGGGITLDTGVTAKSTFQNLIISGELLSFFGSNLYVDSSLSTQRYDTTKLGWSFVLDSRPTQDLFKLERQDASGATTRPMMVLANGSFGFGNLLAIPAFTGAKFMMDSNGNVGIGTTAPGYKLQVYTGTANGFVNADGTWGSSSDERLKKNISPISSTLNNVLALNPVSYNFKTEANGTALHTGFIAQEVEKLFPDLVSTGPDGIKGLSYAMFTPILTKAIQEQQVEITSQGAQINSQETIIETLNTKTLTYDQKFNLLGQNIDANTANILLSQKDITAIQALQTKDQSDIKTLQTQMLDLQTQVKPIIDFYLALNMNNLVYKDSLGNLDITNGKITAKDIEALNSVKAVSIFADSLSLTDSKTSGKGVIAKNTTEVIINTPYVDSASKIYITSQGSTSGKNLYFDNIVNGVSFKVKIDAPAINNDINFNWLILK